MLASLLLELPDALSLTVSLVFCVEGEAGEGKEGGDGGGARRAPEKTSASDRSSTASLRSAAGVAEGLSKTDRHIVIHSVCDVAR